MEEFKLREKIHLVGIGGISMSALAQYFLAEGYAVSGSDVRENEQTLLLRGLDRKSTRLNSSHNVASRMPSSA